MLVPFSWLKEIVPIKEDVNKVAEALTLAGLEVEGVEDAFPWLNSTIAVRIARVKPINENKTVTLCTIDTGKNQVEVICAAPNVREGMLTAYVPPGTQMPDGKEVKEISLYGHTSHGMLASEKELLLEGDDSGIFEIEKRYPSAKVGQALSEITKIKDVVLEIGVTPNRPDCLSILGIAREVAAIFHTNINTPKQKFALDKGVEDLEIEITDPELCSRYVGAVIKGVTVKESPGWLSRRLISSGVRPINNIVDITNYVLMEMGQPLHAFDLNTLSGPKIVVRPAKKGEKIITLDGKERELEAEMLLICDKDRPVAIAGVMGGLETEVTEKSVDILIESAYFNPSSIRKTAKSLKLSTEASYRFERGVDPDGQLSAALRASELILDLAGGTFIGVKDEHPKPYYPVKFSFSPDRVNNLLGTNIPSTKMIEILEAIEIKVTSKEDKALEVSPPSFEVSPPSFRQDIKAEEDIVEEIARCYGFSNIPTSSPVATLIVEKPESFKPFLDKVRQILSAQGLYEIISYSFMSPKELKALKLKEDDPRLKAVRLLNPLAEDQSLMRTNLIAPMLSTISRNLRRRNRDLALFEVGATFIHKGDGVLPNEIQKCCIALVGRRFKESWAWPDTKVDLFDLKGIIENLLQKLNIKSAIFQVAETPEPFFISGTQLNILSGADLLGTLGEIDEKCCKSFDIDEKVFLSDLSISAFSNVSKDICKFIPLDRFPSIERDLAILFDDSVRAQDVLDFITKNAPELLTNFYIFDLYRGKQIPKGKKSLAFRFIYRAKDRTLSEEEVETLHTPLSKSILEKFGGQLRS